MGKQADLVRWRPFFGRHRLDLIALNLSPMLVRDGEVLVADETAVRAEAQVQAGGGAACGRRPGAQGGGAVGGG